MRPKWLPIFTGVVLLYFSTQTESQLQDFAALTRFSVINEGLYQGGKRNGKPDGQGFLVYFTDDVNGRYNYTGEFREGQRHGQGVTIFRSGNEHQGSYMNDKPQGRGELRYTNGDVFEGFFNKGLRQGTGSILYKDGSRRDGEWNADSLNGFVFHHFEGPDSPTVERWEHGRQLDQSADRDNFIDSLLDEIPAKTAQKLSTIPGDHARSLSKSWDKSKVTSSKGDEEVDAGGVKIVVEEESNQRLRRIFDFVN